MQTVTSLGMRLRCKLAWGQGYEDLCNLCYSFRTFLLSIGVLQSACSGHIANSSHLLLSNKSTALIDLSLQLLTEALPPKDPPPPLQPQQVGGAVVGGAYGSKSTSICGQVLRLLASMISTLASGPLRKDAALLSPLLDVIRYLCIRVCSDATITVNLESFIVILVCI